MLQNEIKNSERLYRAIKPIPQLWKAKIDRPSSAAFKDSKGLSVDRKGGRELETIISSFQNSFTVKAIVSITARQCREINSYPIAYPLPDNPYHAEIHRSQDVISLTSGQAKRLSKIAIIEYPE